MHRRLSKSLLWSDPIQKCFENHISSAAKTLSEASQQTAVELELRFGSLRSDRRGQHRFNFPISTPAVLRSNRTQGFFVPGCDGENVANIESRLCELVREKPFESHQLLVATTCEKRFTYSVVSDNGRQITVQPSTACQKRRKEVSDVVFPVPLPAVRLALSTETLIVVSEEERRRMTPGTARIRTRKCFKVDSTFLVDISHVDHAQPSNLQREWQRDLSKQCELFLNRRYGETMVEIEVTPSTLWRLRRRQTTPTAVAQQMLGLTNFLIG